MLRVFGPKRSFLWGWLFASSFLILLVLTGCVISPRRLPGDIVPGASPTPTPTTSPTPSGTPTPTPTGTPTGKLYVSNGGDNAILRFDQALTASGNVAPAATITGNNTQLDAPAYIFLDTAADRLYVANNGGLSILIFDNISGKTGNVAPSRVIAGAATTLIAPTDVSVDTVRNLLYVADDTEVQVFASASTATATGNLAPTRTYSVAFAISALLIDGANDRLYLADQAGQAITVYDNASALASGPITANRTIQGASTHLATPAGIQIDGAGRLVVSNASPGSITIYNGAATATGNIAPSAEIVGSNTGFSVPDQIVVDTTGTGTLYNADPGAARIAIFGALSSSTGNIGPTRSISGANTTLTVAGEPVGVALDRTR